MLSSFPSPSSELVPFIGVRYYGLLIAFGVMAAVWLSRKRWAAEGHNPDEIADIAVWAVPAGLIGARLYHVATDWEIYKDGPFLDIFKVWNGGLGIPGGILLGTIGGFVAAKAYKIDVPRVADAMVPGIPLAQAIGRLGNYFNQELFGRPTNLPWGVRIDEANRPAEYASSPAFQPTFAYEALWNLGVVGLLLWVDSKRVLRPGKILPLYVFGYFTGRLWVEALRSDLARTHIAGLRINTFIALVMMAVGAIWFFWGGALRPESERGERELAGALNDAGVSDFDPSAQTLGADETSADETSADETGADETGEDHVSDAGPEVDGPVAEAGVTEPDQPDVGDGVHPEERS